MAARVPVHPRLRALCRAVAPRLPVALPTALVAHATLGAILAKVGHPAVPLDDAFIHFQYARRLAEGHFFSYVEGEGYTSGATSPLWPLLLAPFHAIGFRDVAIVWPAWALGWIAFAGVAMEAYRLAERLAGRGPAVGAAAMCMAFGAHAWFASSGMEGMPLAWALARTGRVAAEWGEAEPSGRTRKRARELVVLGLVAPLVRPEGAMASVIAAGALAAFPVEGGRGIRARAVALAALAGPVLMPLANVALTGSPASTTALVKWLPMSPYLGRAADLGAAVGGNVRILWEYLLDGREWSAVFVPNGSRPWALGALCAIPLAGWMGGRRWRAGIVLLLALGALLPCTYHTFLWNRVRYLWPFAFAWFVGLACAARLAAEVAAWVHPRGRVAGTVLAAMAAGALLGRLGWSIDDVAGSASAIDRQQVALGRWAAANLPANARIGVNDTGALAYLSGRRTFDVVGLTSAGEARYWTAGAGSRLEHYERLRASEPGRWPTHFIVYPQWMACDAVLGREIHRATVTDQTILGGTTMIVYESRHDLLGSGALPLAGTPGGALLDELDVADLESEADHGYEVGRSRDTDDVILAGGAADGLPRAAVDGARAGRTADRFALRLRPGEAAAIVMRLRTRSDTWLDVRAGGAHADSVHVPEGAWVERTARIPAALAGARTPVEVRARDGATFASAHYWAYGEP